MNRNQSIYLSIILSIFVLSCKEDDPQPLQSEVKAVLLAGERGKSKSWKLTSGTVKDGYEPRYDLAFYSCFLDNIYTFKNNDAQDYDVTEGATICDSRDPDNIVESGTWTFTTDGKMIIILPNNLTGSFNVLFAALPFPATVVELTETSLIIRMDIIDGGVDVVYNLTFVKS